MKQKKNILSKYKRSLTIGDKEWTYRITCQTIDICSPDQKEKWKVFIVTSIDLSCDCDYSFCGCYEYYNGPYQTQVTPSFVKKVIEKKIIEKNRSWIRIGTKETPIGVS